MSGSRKHGGHQTGWKIQNIQKYLNARLMKMLESFCIRKMANSGVSGKRHSSDTLTPCTLYKDKLVARQ